MKNRSLILSIISIFVLSLFILQGCKKDDNTETADFNVGLKSSDLSRSSFEEINIDILSASIHTSADEGETDGWHELETEAGIYNLLEYVNDHEFIFATDPELVVQTVSQIRLLLGENNTIVKDGETYDLDTPSAQTSGIKVQIHTELQPNLTYKVVLNFDSDQSIIETGNDQYKLKPVIKTTVSVVEE
jgi:hypothetical protein